MKLVHPLSPSMHNLSSFFLSPQYWSRCTTLRDLVTDLFWSNAGKERRRKKPFQILAGIKRMTSPGSALEGSALPLCCNRFWQHNRSGNRKRDDRIRWINLESNAAKTGYAYYNSCPCLSQLSLFLTRQHGQGFFTIHLFTFSMNELTENKL